MQKRSSENQFCRRPQKIIAGLSPAPRPIAGSQPYQDIAQNSRV
nr:MAG TPA: hypothetical protein [Inoviridae sp.]